MSSSSGKGNFVEINDHAVIAIRSSLANGSLRIDAWKEIALQNRMEAAEAIQAVFPEGSTDSPFAVQCAFRPAQRFFKIASADESKQHHTAAAARAFVASGLPAGFEPAEIACMYTGDGRLLGGGGNGRWFAAAASRESIDAASAMLREWNLKATRFESAAVGLLGVATSSLVKKPSDEPLVIWDACADYSDLFLVSSAGVQGTRRVDFGYEHVFEALMSEIQLKFKGAAVRLFFNDRYDFSEAGPKIAGRVAAALQEALAALALQAGGRMPTTFCCASLPSKQAWFNQHLAGALHLTPWAPDLAAWVKEAEITFADTAVIETLVPNSFSALSMMANAHRQPEAEPWHGAWVGGATEFSGKAATPPAAPAKGPASAAKSTETPVAKPVVVSTPPVSTKSAPVPVAAKAAVVATAEATRTPAKKGAPAPAFPAPSKAPGGEGQASTKVEAAAKTPDKTTPPPAKSDPAAAAAGPGAPVAAATQKSGSKMGLVIGIAAAIVLGGGYFAYSSMQSQKAAAELERVEAEKRAAELVEANRQAELKAEAEAEARRIAEEQAAAQLKAAQAERQRADQEAREREAEHQRLLNTRGSIVVKTEPADATVTVGNLVPRPSPAAFHDLRLGNYKVEVSKPGYDTVRFEVDVKESGIIDRGTIALVRQTGALALDSQPAGSSYFVEPVSSGGFSLERSAQFRGVTPANLASLPTGEYTVTFERPGWTTKTQKVRIEKGATAKVTQAFAGGTVQITTIPEGAEVFANNVSIGRTPLTLENVSPGKVDYRLELADHIPANTAGTVEPEKALELTTFLVPIEKLARVADLDSPPRPTKTVQPKLPKDANEFKGQKVLISVVIDENGEPRDWRIIQTPDPTLADACIEAIAQWRFEPGTVKGRPVKVRVTVPLIMN